MSFRYDLGRPIRVIDLLSIFTDYFSSKKIAGS